MKKIIAMLLVLTMVLSMIGCGQSGSESAAPEETAPVEEESPLAFPVTVTDQAGRTVTIEAEPERIVSGYYISTSLLIALDLDEKLVGINTVVDDARAKGGIYDPSGRRIHHIAHPGVYIISGQKVFVK